MSEPGITHSGPGTVDISGAAIGGSGGGQAAPAREPEASGPFLRNEGVLNLGPGQINMSGCVTGPGAILRIGGPEPEPEAGL